MVSFSYTKCIHFEGPSYYFILILHSLQFFFYLQCLCFNEKILMVGDRFFFPLAKEKVGNPRLFLLLPSFLVNLH